MIEEITVHVVFGRVFYEDSRCFGIYLSRKLAEKRLKEAVKNNQIEYHDDYWIEEIEVNEKLNLLI